ncbi:MAG: hypothetical protein ACKO2P_10140 [Planctomycetota bacterium]
MPGRSCHVVLHEDADDLAIAQNLLNGDSPCWTGDSMAKPNTSVLASLALHVVLAPFRGLSPLNIGREI